MEPICLGRCLFYTTSGHISLGPGNIARNDIIYIFGGAIMPIVMRPLGDHFGIIGDCYLNGIMDGEAIIEITQGKALHGPIPISNTNRQAQSHYEPLKLRVISFTSLQGSLLNFTKLRHPGIIY